MIFNRDPYMFAVEGWGRSGSSIPASGDDGASIIHGNITLPADNDAQFYCTLDSVVATGTLTLNEDGSFTWLNMPAGTHEFSASIYRNGVLNQSGIVRVVVS